jgi:hypothetical protein
MGRSFFDYTSGEFGFSVSEDTMLTGDGYQMSQNFAL